MARAPINGPVWVVVPTYEEAATIEQLLRAVLAATRPVVAGEVRVLVVDDGSPDGTAEIAERVGDEVGGVEVMRRSTKDGLAAAYRAGFARALEGGARLICQMDADLSHDPAALPRMLAATAHADVVLGSRYVPGGGVEDWSRARRVLSRGGGIYARRVLGIGVRDLTGGFKCFRREALEAVDLGSVRSRGYAFQIEVTYRAIRAGFRVAEVPITFRERSAGESKMTAAIALEAAWRVPLLRKHDGAERHRPLAPWASLSRRIALILFAAVLLSAGAVWAASRGGKTAAAPPHPVPTIQSDPSPLPTATPIDTPARRMASAQRRRDVSRAAALYGAMQSVFYHSSEKLFVERSGRKSRPPHNSFLWPYSQAVSAILASSGVPGGATKSDLSDRIAGFERYWDTAGIPAYAFRVQLRSADPNEHKYYDDEGWVALDLLRLHAATGSPLAFQRAQEVFAFLTSGWDSSPSHKCPGGVLWKQPPNNKTRTTVSTATAGEVAVRLYMLTGKPSYLAWAKTMDGWLQRCLARGDGLLRDNIDQKGHVDAATWSYNQGSAMTLASLLYQATGQRSYLDRGLKLARSAARQLRTAQFLRETRIFPAIFFDNLLRFPAGSAAEHDRWRAAAQAWADREWSASRDPASGVVRRGPTTPPQLIDQAALLQLYSDLANDGQARPAGA
ncbi:MAG: Dolichyl-phosphate beta-D-mannosyltransferase [Solirubrobacterales bacterium]|jgi:dolichol-phosphate mannosyltransferase|nr:Dolichyl-phosphate beta-D-mannosyltransferase [Solirubrobacterales bacterium]